MKGFYKLYIYADNSGKLDSETTVVRESLDEICDIAFENMGAADWCIVLLGGYGGPELAFKSDVPNAKSADDIARICYQTAHYLDFRLPNARY